MTWILAHTDAGLVSSFEGLSIGKKIKVEKDTAV